MSECPLLVTNIALDNLQDQQLAIASWLRLGFSVSSLNTSSEINELRPLFQGVEFVAIQRDTRADGGKSPVYLDEVIAVLRSSRTPVCGMINSDIHLRAAPETVRYLLGEANNSVLLASRTDVKMLGEATGEVYQFGFDVFLFDRAILNMLPAAEFCLGQPWWDLWLASRFISSPHSPPCPFALKFLAFPFARHVQREKSQDWDDNDKKYGILFAKWMDPGTHQALLAQPPQTLRNSLSAMRHNVATAILFECRWISCFPEEEVAPAP